MQKSLSLHEMFDFHPKKRWNPQRSQVEKGYNLTSVSFTPVHFGEWAGVDKSGNKEACDNSCHPGK